MPRISVLPNRDSNNCHCGHPNISEGIKYYDCLLPYFMECVKEEQAAAGLGHL